MNAGNDDELAGVSEGWPPPDLEDSDHGGRPAPTVAAPGRQAGLRQRLLGGWSRSEIWAALQGVSAILALIITMISLVALNETRDDDRPPAPTSAAEITGFVPLDFTVRGGLADSTSKPVSRGGEPIPELEADSALAGAAPPALSIHEQADLRAELLHVAYAASITDARGDPVLVLALQDFVDVHYGLELTPSSFEATGGDEPISGQSDQSTIAMVLLWLVAIVGLCATVIVASQRRRAAHHTR